MKRADWCCMCYESCGQALMSAVSPAPCRQHASAFSWHPVAGRAVCCNRRGGNRRGCFPLAARGARWPWLTVTVLDHPARCGGGHSPQATWDPQRSRRLHAQAQRGRQQRTFHTNVALHRPHSRQPASPPPARLPPAHSLPPPPTRSCTCADFSVSCCASWKITPSRRSSGVLFTVPARKSGRPGAAARARWRSGARISLVVDAHARKRGGRRKAPAHRRWARRRGRRARRPRLRARGADEVCRRRWVIVLPGAQQQDACAQQESCSPFCSFVVSSA